MSERRDNKNRLLQSGEYQRKDGRYVYKYVDHNGNDRYVYSWTLTQTDRAPKGKSSDKCLRELEKDIAKDLQDEIDTYNANKLTLNAFYEDFISQKIELKPSTRENYKYMYRKYVWDYLGHRKLSNIKYSDIKKFYNHLIVDLKFKPNTLEIIHNFLYPIFTIAVRDGYIRLNPTNGVMAEIKKSYSWEKKRKHPLTVEEQEAFIEYTKNSDVYNHWLPLFTVMLGTGCRIGEIIGLTWSDCDFKENLISINHNLIYRKEENTGKCKFHVTTPKTKAGIRVVPMFQAVKQALLQEKLRQMKDGFNTSVIDGYSGFVFSNKYNEALSPHNVNRAIERITRDYNAQEIELAKKEQRQPLLLPHFTAHILRHTFCTRMCENVTNIKVIQEIMGHSDITTTMDIYNEATVDKKKESFAQLEGIIKVS